MVVLVTDDDTDDNLGVSIWNTTVTPWVDEAKVDDLSTGAHAGAALIYDLDGIGDPEILVAYRNSQADIAIAAYRADLTIYSASWPVTMTGMTVTGVSSPVFVDMAGTNQICAYALETTGTNGLRFLCTTTVGTSTTSGQIAYTQLSSPISYAMGPLIAADVDNDGDDELLTPRGAYEVGTYTEVALFGQDEASQLSIGDTGTNEWADLLFSGSGLLKVFYSGGMTSAQYCALTDLFSPSVVSVYRDTGNPVCPGNNVTFSVTLDDTDPIRLLVDCDGDGTTDVTSNYSNSTIRSVTCPYLSVGSFLVSFTVNDECMLTGSATESVLVSSGVCYSQGEGAGVSVPGSSSAGAGNSVEEFFGDIEDATGMSKLVLWLIFMFGVGIAVVFAALKGGWGGSAMSMMLLFSEGGMVVLGAVFGFIGVGVVIVLAVLCIAALVIWAKDAFGGA